MMRSRLLGCGHERDMWTPDTITCYLYMVGERCDNGLGLGSRYEASMEAEPISAHIQHWEMTY